MQNKSKNKNYNWQKLNITIYKYIYTLIYTHPHHTHTQYNKFINLKQFAANSLKSKKKKGIQKMKCI